MNFNLKILNWKQKTDDTAKLISLDDVRKQCLMAMSQIDTLSNHRWHFFRSLLNENDFDSREIAVNRAFYKLWEILKLYPPILRPLTGDSSKDTNAPISTLHLAEAPGSFVQVVKKMYKNSTCVATSKPPSTYAEVVEKGKTIPIFNENLLKSGTSANDLFIYMDLLKKDNILYYTEKFKANFPEGFDLITADGGFDEEERYDEKETLHYNLILAEIIFILFNQKIGGECVLKIFETFTDTSLYILWLLCGSFEEFHILKPSTSRPTNAERYVVCRGFKGHIYDKISLLGLVDKKITKDLILNISLPKDYVRLMENACHESTSNQIATINSVIKFVNDNTGGKNGSVYVDKRRFLEQKTKSFAEWKEKYEFVDTPPNF